MEYEIEIIRREIISIEDAISKLKNSSCCAKYDLTNDIQFSLTKIGRCIDDIEEEHDEEQSEESDDEEAE